MSNFISGDLGAQFTVTDITAELATDLVKPRNAYTYLPHISKQSITFESTFDVNSELFNRLCGVDSASDPISMEYQTPYLVQTRRHKKKRINKKWAKRYDYKTAYHKSYLDNCVLSNLSDGLFEVTGYPRGN